MTRRADFALFMVEPPLDVTLDDAPPRDAAGMGAAVHSGAMRTCSPADAALVGWVAARRADP
jgi:hypothetical protein